MSTLGSDVLEKQLALAWHLLEIGRPERALETLQTLPGGGLDEPEAWLIRSAALHDAKRYDDAADVARRGLELEPQSIGLLAVLSLAEAQRGDLAAAERAIVTGLGLDPENFTLLCDYAHLLVRGLQLGKAAHVLDRAQRLAPEHPDVARARMALAYVSANKRALERTTEALLSLEPEDASAHRSIAVSRTDRGDVKRAARHFVEAARADPYDHEAAAAAREARINEHWLFWPLRPIWRYGRFMTYAAYLGVIVALGGLADAAEKTLGAGVAAAFYLLAVCAIFALPLLFVYCWIGPPLIRAWLRRRAR